MLNMELCCYYTNNPCLVTTMRAGRIYTTSITRQGKVGATLPTVGSMDVSIILRCLCAATHTYVPVVCKYYV